MTYQELCKSLASRYPEREAKAVIRYLLEVGYGLSMADIISGAAESIPSDEMGKKLRRLLNGEPVQYVVGKAEFGGRIFRVTPDVLIPRPETYELCQWLEEEERGKRKEERDFSILDIGTGSGCIAITLALDMPQAKVEAWDISADALTVARENAQELQAKVKFEQVDVLSSLPAHGGLGWVSIISNPPYICQKEAVEMEQHVLDHEPHQALFVPDEDPLLFYRAIAKYGQKALQKNGQLYFEINPAYYQELTKMLDEMGYSEIETRKDQFGRNRMIKAKRT
jgi:release factor glutamine methyltransferase